MRTERQTLWYFQIFINNTASFESRSLLNIYSDDEITF